MGFCWRLLLPHFASPYIHTGVFFFCDRIAPFGTRKVHQRGRFVFSIEGIQNGGFPIAMFDYRRVFTIRNDMGFFTEWTAATLFGLNLLKLGLIYKDMNTRRNETVTSFNWTQHCQGAHIRLRFAHARGWLWMQSYVGTGKSRFVPPNFRALRIFKAQNAWLNYHRSRQNRKESLAIIHWNSKAGEERLEFVGFPNTTCLPCIFHEMPHTFFLNNLHRNRDQKIYAIYKKG